ncbi:MAG: nicotinate-nucleotide--dimethylbenzimidazole phosphoribosyltransferase [Eubacteriales bacterium]|nr:nicotinate-nucleotide--dimethylbenzimidazole phosphoribosyltransferase [Eubacteriales bacterium]
MKILKVPGCAYKIPEFRNFGYTKGKRDIMNKPVFNEYTLEELKKIEIEAPDKEMEKKVQANWDAIAKPLDGMGRFEKLTAQIGAIMRTDRIDISKKAVLIMIADNGVVEEGVTQTGQEVTFAVACSMSKKLSSVCKMAILAGAETIPVDVGINDERKIDDVIDRKIRRGTRNFAKEPAMTEEEAIRAIATGIELVGECAAKGYKLIATGEMGIGNTTTSSAVTASLLRCDSKAVTGRGAGLSDSGLLTKQRVIAEAIEKYGLHDADAFTILRTVGGLDIAGLVGVCIGGAIYHVPIVLDGVISMASALMAERLIPGTAAYMIPSHMGKEPAVVMLTEALGVKPVILGELALGEGTGAVMMFPLLDMAMSIYSGSPSFSQISVEQYKRF